MFTFGVKVEDNDFLAQIEVQPTARLLWTPNEKHSVWGAISRSVSTPTRSDTDSFLIYCEEDSIECRIRIGDTEAKHRIYVSNELGYRWFIFDQWIMDMTVFFEQEQVVLENRVFGLEMNNKYIATEDLRFELNYYFHKGYNEESKAIEVMPRHSMRFSAFWDVSREWSVDTLFYASTFPANLKRVQSANRLDFQVTWRADDLTSLNIGIQNLLDEVHKETQDSFKLETGVERSFFIQVTHQF
jgi:iron complex outermembrane recepter protein